VKQLHGRAPRPAAAPDHENQFVAAAHRGKGYRAICGRARRAGDCLSRTTTALRYHN
jgi:hypothetical protein